DNYFQRMHFGNPPTENPKAAYGDAMLHNSPTAELEMKIPPRYSGSVNFGPVIPPLSSRVPVRRAPLAGCCISDRTVFIVSRGKARRRNRVHAFAMADPGP